MSSCGAILATSILASMSVACAASNGSPDAGVPIDAGANVDAGVPAEDGGAPRDGNGGTGTIQLDGGISPPDGRVSCYFGTNYQCNADGEECCDENDTCYFPATEPEFCK